MPHKQIVGRKIETEYGQMAKEHLGTVSIMHSSGMVETDKGFKYPNVSAKIGDVMYQEGHNIYFMDKKEWQELNEPKTRAKRRKKADDEKQQNDDEIEESDDEIEEKGDEDDGE